MRIEGLKRLSAVLLCGGFSFCATAQNGAAALFVTTRNMGEVVLALSQKPAVSFTATEVVLKTEDVTFSYPLAEHVQMTFGKSDQNAIQKVSEVRTVVSCMDGKVEVSGAEAGTAVGLFATDGRLLQTAKADSEGRATLKMDTKGIFVVKVGKVSMKISNNK